VRKPLRHALATIAAAGFRVEAVRQAGKHTEIYVEGGGLVRLHRGCRMSVAFERGLRSAIRRWGAP
jgi:hypothetical protein